MRLKILAPHQTINGVEIPPGDTVEVANRTTARNLIASGYAVEDPVTETTVAAADDAPQASKPADDPKTTNRKASK